MKRYGHAWIALRAIDRLGKYAEEAKEKNKKTPEKAQKKYDSIIYLQSILRKRAKLVLEGAWIPDNVINDNLQDGHTWKYKPLMKTGKDVMSYKKPTEVKGVYVKEDDEYFNKKHYTTSSLCYNEADSTDMWNQPFRKKEGRLVDRCESIRQSIRDQFLLQQNEMHKLAGTLIVKFGDKLTTDDEEVRSFLEDPVEVKVFYDMKYKTGNYVYRDEIISKRNKYRNNKKVQAEFDKSVKHYGEDIKAHIAELNALRFLDNKPSFFPLYFTDEQIALSFFTLSHYLADAHMPLHCDMRAFSCDGCGDIHEDIEKLWDNWVIDEDVGEDIVQSLSESERATRFMSEIFKDQEPLWDNFVYPNTSLLKRLDDNMGIQLWNERKAKFYPNVDIWKQMVGVTYASYCLASRLFPFNDNVRIVPMGDKFDYKTGYEGCVKEVKSDNWINEVNTKNLKLPKKYYKTKPDEINNLRKGIYEAAKAHGGDIVFNYLSLLVFVDAVECVAKVWARTVDEYFDLITEPKSP